jgi:hypothetical protein
MLKSDPKKNYLQLALCGLAVMVLQLPLNQESKAEPDPKQTQAVPALKEIKAVPKTNLSPAVTAAGETKDTTASGVEIIVGDKPLAIPKEFRKTLDKLGITGITLGDKQGRIHLLKADGTYVNPCAITDKDSASKTTGREKDQACRFEAGLGETHMLIANKPLAAAGCGTCLGGGSTRVCDKATRKYTCSTKASLCSNNCV